jgi:L-alanine-DL-glutamate epimerase-like enolase superfamily enzyme
MIEALTVTYYRKPYRRAITNGKYTYTESRLVMVRVTDHDGVTGIGWVSGGETVFQAAVELAPLVLGADPLAVERVWDRLYQPKLIGRKGLTTRAISAIDIALWDAMGKRLGVSVHRLLGAYRDSIPAYAAGGYYEEGKGLAELAEEMVHYVELGARAVKMKIGALSLEEDAARVRAVREAVGETVSVLVDANGAYDTATARLMARKLAPWNPFWFEEPLSPENFAGYRWLRQDGLVRIAHGENEYTRYGFRDLLVGGLADVINPDAQVLGGVTEWRKVAALAASHEIPVAPHGNQEIHVHLVTGLPGGLLLEFYHDNVVGLAVEMIANRLRLNSDGTVSPPAAPGLGVELDEDLLARHRVLQETVRGDRGSSGSPR